jgi:hypothetical protein
MECESHATKNCKLDCCAAPLNGAKKGPYFFGGIVVNDRMFWGYHHNFSIRLNSVTNL